MRRFLILVPALLLAAACSQPKKSSDKSGSTPSATAPAVTAASQAAADDIFKTRCTPCHGASGGGDGPASASLNPHPRNFHDKTWQGQVTDEHIQKIIQYGGAAVGKSPNMPANPDLQSKPDVVAALAMKVRTFGKQ